MKTSVWRGLKSEKEWPCSGVLSLSSPPIQANFHAVPGWWFAFQMSLKEAQCMSREQGLHQYSTGYNNTVIYWHYRQSIDIRTESDRNLTLIENAETQGLLKSTDNKAAASNVWKSPCRRSYGYKAIIISLLEGNVVPCWNWLKLSEPLVSLLQPTKGIGDTRSSNVKSSARTL